MRVGGDIAKTGWWDNLRSPEFRRMASKKKFPCPGGGEQGCLGCIAQSSSGPTWIFLQKNWLGLSDGCYHSGLCIN